ncbi:MAG: protein kinase domain-containing protein [Planctomycetota bacterium]
MTAADDSVPPSEDTRRLSAEKAREQLLADPLLRDAPVVEGFKVLEPAVLYAKVGAGGMGAVYRGRHFKLDLDVAVKCLKPALLQEEDDFVKRFEREARLAASIAHQNVVRVMDVQERNGLHYLVMEFVRGETAAERVKRKGPLPEKEALAILYGVTAGLAAAHQKGIVHRDLKPENVMISLDGEVKLADLGLAKSQGGIDGRSISMAASQIMGTPQYMPPEQWETTDVTAAADIWALGATFFYLVTGRTGISGAGTWQAVMKRVTEQPYPPLRQERADLRPEVHALFERCVQKLPQDRFADARALLRELKKLAIDDDDSVLLDPATGSLRDRQGLVTPPPRETVLKIRAIVETEAAGRTTEPEPAGPRAPKSEDLTRQSPRPQRSRAGGWLLGLAATALLAAGGTYAAGLWPGGAGDATKGDNATPRDSNDAEADKAKPPANTPPAPPAGDPRADARAAFAKGQQLLPQKGQLDAAIAAFEQALQLDPSLDDVKAPLAGALGRRAEQLAATDLDQAFDLCRRAAELRPGDAVLTQRHEQLRAQLAARLVQGLTIEAPADRAAVADRTVVLRGSADSKNLRSVRVALVTGRERGSKAPSEWVAATVVDGSWSAAVPVTRDGPHQVWLQAEDSHGVTGDLARAWVVVVDTADPVLTLSQPLAGIVTPAKVTLRGKVVDDSRCAVQVDGQSVPVGADGTFSRELQLADGDQSLLVVATDEAGRRAEMRRTLRVDAVAPTIELATLPKVTKDASLSIAGRIVGLDGGKLTLDGSPVEVAADGRFTASVPLGEDRDFTFLLVATDAVGNPSEQRVLVRRDTTPPVVEWSAPPEGQPVPAGDVEIRGSARDAGGVASVLVNGKPATRSGTQWQAVVSVREDQQLGVTVVATDEAGNPSAPLVRTLVGAPAFEPRIEAGGGIVMLRIEPKPFTMGSSVGADGTPHRVTISRPYWIAETEVTQTQWREVMQTTPWTGQSYTSVGPSHPATYVSWTDAVAFCETLTKRESAAGRLPPGHRYALPTEAEWEYACRGGSAGAYCYGDGEGRLSEFAVFGKEFKETNGADRVRTKKPNAFGLYDMHGNVWEWCADWADYTDGKAATDTYREGVTDPLSLRGALRVYRGGSWSIRPAVCRSAYRGANVPSVASGILGFRPALVARPPAK